MSQQKWRPFVKWRLLDWFTYLSVLPVVWLWVNVTVGKNPADDFQKGNDLSLSLMSSEINLDTGYSLRIREVLATFRANPRVDPGIIKMHVVHDCAIYQAWAELKPVSGDQISCRIYLCENVLSDFDRENLAAILTHETAHIENMSKGESGFL